MSCRKNFSKIIGIISATLLIVILLSPAVFAYPSHTDYISDGAVILDENTENSIRAASSELMKTKNSRLAVCTVLNTGDKNAKDYATALFKEWEVGNGVLILLVTEADTFYAVQSNSVAEVLTSEKLSEILNSTLEPKFAEKDYSAGALAAVNALSVFLNNNLPQDFGSEQKSGMPGWLSVILKLVLVIAILLIAGYAALVIAEKRKARRRREEMEARRRMIANGVRTGYGRQPHPYNNRGGAPRNPGAVRGPRTQKPNGSGIANVQRIPSARRNTSSAPAPRRTQNPPSYNNVTSAATIQINTADIRAAKQAQDKRASRR